MNKFSLLIFWILIFTTIDTSAQIPLKFPGNENALIGIDIVSLEGSNIAKYNSTKLMTPASITKCVTSAACVIGLPDDFRFCTYLKIAGHISDSILEGDVILAGNGDPTIESSHFPELLGFIPNIVSSLHKIGIDSIAGRFILAQNKYPDFGYSPYWMLEDIGWDYGTGLFGINYKDNTINLIFNNRFSNDYLCSPEVNIPIYNNLQAGDNDIAIYPSLDEWAISIIGTAKDSGSPLKLKCANRHPDQTIYDELKQYIPIGNSNIGDTTNITEIYCHQSPSRDKILRSMMVRSDNLFAQGMLRALLADSVDVKSDSRAIPIAKKHLKSIGIDCNKQIIVDGCGLARNTKISPQFMTKMLVAMANSNYRDEYVALFPIVGKEGTVKRMLHDTRLRGTLALKSGSMSGVLCYSGYKLNENGEPTHAITIMVNNFSCKTREIRTAIERYLLEIF